jgi:hypothetical protein
MEEQDDDGEEEKNRIKWLILKISNSLEKVPRLSERF